MKTFHKFRYRFLLSYISCFFILCLDHGVYPSDLNVFINKTLSFQQKTLICIIT